MRWLLPGEVHQIVEVDQGSTAEIGDLHDVGTQRGRSPQHGYDRGHQVTFGQGTSRPEKVAAGLGFQEFAPWPFG